MRIALAISDGDLARALAELLESHGHVVQPVAEGERGCALRIVREVPLLAAPPGTATLYLERSGAGVNGEAARRGLLAALRTGGTCTWQAPLSPRLLLAVLGESEGAQAPAAPPVGPPSLADTSHPWLVLDPQGGRLRRANLAACGLLDLPRQHEGLALDRLALPGALREGLLHESSGMRPVEHLDGARLAMWWTDAQGQRVLCLLPQPLIGLSADDLHRRSLAELGRTAATLAHELRNPVASVAGALDLLEEEEKPGERAQIVALARERLKHLTKLLEFTLFLARPLRHETEAVDLRGMVEATVASLRTDPLFDEVRIETELGADEVRVLVQAEPLRQALINLLLNAAQAQDGKGVIRVQVRRDGRRGIVRIADEGPGIPPARREEEDLGPGAARRVTRPPGRPVPVSGTRSTFGAPGRLRRPPPRAPSTT